MSIKTNKDVICSSCGEKMQYVEELGYVCAKEGCSEIIYEDSDKKNIAKQISFIQIICNDRERINKRNLTTTFRMLIAILFRDPEYAAVVYEREKAKKFTGSEAPMQRVRIKDET